MTTENTRVFKSYTVSPEVEAQVKAIIEEDNKEFELIKDIMMVGPDLTPEQLQSLELTPEELAKIEALDNTYLDPVLRAELATKWNKQELPMVTFKHYIVYKYFHMQYPFVVGHDDPGITKELASSLIRKPHVVWVETADSYPFEIAKIWKEKDKKK
jgi:hypothetical protein